MGRRGPPPTPTKILKLRGSRRAARRGAEPEPEPLREDTPPPEHLDPEAQDAWRQVLPELARLRLFTRLDRMALELYSEAVSDFRRACRWLRENGDTIVFRDKDGRVKYISQAPHVAIKRAAAARLLAFAREFGLTPAARVHLAQGDSADAPPKENRFIRLA